LPLLLHFLETPNLLKYLYHTNNLTVQKISNSNVTHIIIIIGLLYFVFIFFSKGEAVVEKKKSSA